MMHLKIASAVRFALRPEIHLTSTFRFISSSIFQLKPSDARVMTSRIERAAYGVNLFAYNNIKTNQVIYSLKQTLDVRISLNQTTMVTSAKCDIEQCGHQTTPLRGQKHKASQAAQRHLAAVPKCIISLCASRSSCLSQAARIPTAPRTQLGHGRCKTASCGIQDASTEKGRRGTIGKVQARCRRKEESEDGL